MAAEPNAASRRLLAPMSLVMFFEQARDEHGQRGHEQRRPQPGQRHVARTQHQQARQRAGQHRQPAHARRGAGMVRLRLVEIAVAGEGAMPALRHHDESPTMNATTQMYSQVTESPQVGLSRQARHYPGQV